MAQLAVEMTGDEAKLFRSLQNIIGQQKRVKEGFDKVGAAGAKAGKSGEKAFGDKAVVSLQKFAAALLAIQAGAEKVRSTMQKVREESEKAGRSLIDASAGRRAFISISGGDPKKFREISQVAQNLRVTQGLTPQQANDLTFQLFSAGVQKDAALFAQLGDIGFKPTEGVSSVQKLQSVFGKGAGAAGAGTAEQILNKLIIAAEASPVGPGRIAGQATTAATSFAAIGGSDEALLAMGAVLIKSFKNAESSFQRIKSLSSQIFKKGELIDFEPGKELRGIELIQNLSRLGREGRLRTESGDVVDAKKFLGEVNAVEALKAFEKRESEILALRQQLIESETTDSRTLRRNISIAQGDTALNREKFLRIAQQKRKVTEETDLGEQFLQTQSLEEREDQITREKNRGKSFGEIRNIIERQGRATERAFRGEAGFAASRETNVPATQTEPFGGH